MQSSKAVEAPGAYSMEAALYHADPCPAPSLSASMASKLVTYSPLHAFTAHPRLNPYFSAEHKDHFDLGSAAHNMVLRQEYWREEIEVIDAADWRGKAAKEARDKARGEGRIPVLKQQYEELNRMVQAIEKHPQASNAFRKGKPEQTLIWQDPKAGIWMRCRPDWMPDDPSAPWPDYKTTGDARPEIWDRRFCLDHGGLMRAAFYEEGIRQVCGIAQPTLYYIVQETAAPFAVICRVMNSQSSKMEIGRAMLRRAINTFAACLESGTWPSYPAVGEIQISEWAERDLVLKHHDWMPREEKTEDKEIFFG